MVSPRFSDSSVLYIYIKRERRRESREESEGKSIAFFLWFLLVCLVSWFFGELMTRHDKDLAA